MNTFVQQSNQENEESFLQNSVVVIQTYSRNSFFPNTSVIFHLKRRSASKIKRVVHSFFIDITSRCKECREEFPRDVLIKHGLINDSLIIVTTAAVRRLQLHQNLRNEKGNKGPAIVSLLLAILFESLIPREFLETPPHRSVAVSQRAR